MADHNAPPLPLPPTIPRTQLLINVKGLASDMPYYIRQYRETYGDIYRLKVASHNLVIVTSPEFAKHVLVDNNRNYIKAFGYKFLADFLGQGLLTSEGEFWKKQRRLAQPAFHKRNIDNFVAIMAEESDQVAQRWRQLAASGKTVDIGNDLMEITMKVVARALFSTDVSHVITKVSNAISVLNEWSMKRLRRPLRFPKWFPTPLNLKAKKAIRDLDEVVFYFIQERRKNPAHQHDLLSMLMNAADEDTGEKMTDAQLRDEIVTLFVAGHETTAVALSWTHFLLATHPEIRSRVYDELKSVLNGRAPGVEDVPRLQFLRQVVDESMRLYPPAWVVGRMALEDDQLGKYRVPAGANVLVISYEMHRHPALWENPEKFDPDRFSPSQESHIPKMAYIPFGAGQRMCIGNVFALTELIVILAVQLQQVELDYKGKNPPEYQPLITLRPREAKFSFKARKG